MTTSDFYIKPGYRENVKPVTVDSISGDHYWNNSRIALSSCYQYPVYKYAVQLIKDKEFKRIIDVGCGLAPKLAWIHKQLPHTEVLGIDQIGAIEYCRNKYNFGTWIVDDIENPKRDYEFPPGDLVISSDVIEHLLNPDTLLEYLREIMNPHGYILLSTPERDLMRGIDCMYSPNPNHIREWNYQELSNYLENRGFKILEHFLQLPVRMGINTIALKEIVMRTLMGKPAKYNQVCLLQRK